MKDFLLLVTFLHVATEWTTCSYREDLPDTANCVLRDEYVSYDPLYPGTNIERVHVPENFIKWNKKYPRYKPVDFCHESIIGQPWADEDITPKNRKSFEYQWNHLNDDIDRRRVKFGFYGIDENTGRPLNPNGRVGIAGRGLLGRWGPNRSSKLIVTRWVRDEKGEKVILKSSQRPVLECVLVRMNDEWYIPGGFLEKGDTYESSCQREFLEEAMNASKTFAEDYAKKEKALLNVFENKTNYIHQGYLHDNRNTDNAWVEGCILNAHDETGEFSKQLIIKPGDGVQRVAWIVIHKNIKMNPMEKLYLEMVANQLHLGTW